MYETYNHRYIAHQNIIVKALIVLMSLSCQGPLCVNAVLKQMLT